LHIIAICFTILAIGSYYERVNQVKKIFLASVAAGALISVPARAEILVVNNDTGFMNVRGGPGTNYPILGTVSNGTRFIWDGTANCVPRQDGPGYDFCKIKYNGGTGWVSHVGLVPVDITPPVITADSETFHCGRAQVWPPENDPNPVISTDITHNPNTHVWTVNHYRLDGSIVARQQQYAITDWPFPGDVDDARWTGDLLRDPHRYIHMVGSIKWTNQGIFYEEQVYNRSQGDRMDTRIISQCEVVRPVAPAPVAVVPVVPVAPVIPVVPVAPPPAVVNNNNITVAPQAAPPVITVAPVIVIPGVTGAGQYPAPPAERPVPKAEAGS
jgi:hypothetical protein